jgi:hypothetical protein
MNNIRLRLPEVVVPGKRLGRHINHDIRSARYLVAETSNPASASWDSRIDILDQGNLGSCTGNATTGELGTEPFFDTLPKGTTLDESFAVTVYESATRLDSYPGQYKPDDTGSDGLSAAKAAQKLGMANGYLHAVSLAGLHTMIQSGPFAVGVSWHSDMDNPDSNGVVKVGGKVRGGHELCVVAYDSGSNLWKIRNSWGSSWAKDGYCFWSDDDMAKLLAEQGDATQLTPLNQPAPTPTPTPTPPAPQPTDPAFVAWMRDVDAQFTAFDAHPWSRGKRDKLRAAVNAWKIEVS